MVSLLWDASSYVLGTVSQMSQHSAMAMTGAGQPSRTSWEHSEHSLCTLPTSQCEASHQEVFMQERAEEVGLLLILRGCCYCMEGRQPRVQAALGIPLPNPQQAWGQCVCTGLLLLHLSALGTP